MQTLSIELTEQEFSELHTTAVKNGMSDQDFVKSSIWEALPLHERSDDEIGAHLHTKYRELYRRLS